MSNQRPLELRERVLGELQAGGILSVVAARHGISCGTLKSWLRRWRETGSPAPKPPGGGAPFALSHTDLDTLRHLVEKDPTAPAPLLRERLLAAGAPQISVSTVCRALRRLGYKRSPLALGQQEPQREKRAPKFRRRPSTPLAREGLRQPYPSDLTDEEWKLVATLLPPAPGGGRPRRIERRELLDAMLYVLRTGCQWRALPHDFPHWKTVYTVFRQWRNDGLFERLNTTLRRRLRREDGRDEVASVWVLDSQTVKTTEKGGSVVTTAPSASSAASGRSSSTRSAY